MSFKSFETPGEKETSFPMLTIFSLGLLQELQAIGLPGGSIIYQSHLFSKKDTYG